MIPPGQEGRGYRPKSQDPEEFKVLRQKGDWAKNVEQTGRKEGGRRGGKKKGAEEKGKKKGEIETQSRRKRSYSQRGAKRLL